MKPSSHFNNLHFVGIGGAGMSALAEALAGFGFKISGSDKSNSLALQRLRSLGVNVFVGHDESQVSSHCHAVVYSAAVDFGNPELRIARTLEIPIMRRADLLGTLVARKFGMAIAGTHGKTTTTGMLVHILLVAGVDPSWVAGGTWLGGAPGHAGSGKYLVVEADEYDRAFHSLRPMSAVVTNVDGDHLDIYGTVEAVENAFAIFLEQLPFDALAIVNMDDPGVRRVLNRVTRRCSTFGLSQGDYQARDIQFTSVGVKFKLWRDGREAIDIVLNVPGLHNVSNALGAAAMALEEGISLEAVAKGLERFPGMRRRMEKIGEREGIFVYDDYAHHPSEVAATLSAAKKMTQGRVVVVFQPHLFSRTQQLLHAFAQAFLSCDKLYCLPVYAAREEPIPGVDGDLLVAEVKRQGHLSAQFLTHRNSVAAEVAKGLLPGDICITMGAGDVGELAIELMEKIA